MTKHGSTLGKDNQKPLVTQTGKTKERHQVFKAEMNKGSCTDNANLAAGKAATKHVKPMFG